jgi:hypothetical protein
MRKREKKDRKKLRLGRRERRKILKNEGRKEREDIWFKKVRGRWRE